MALALDKFLKQLEDSGIIEAGKLANFIPPRAAPKDAEDLARELIRQKHLTKFQAQQIVSGRAKNLILGNYTLLEKIGAGGMGQVFKAYHRRMDRIVAIKMLPPTLLHDGVSVAGFEREVRAAAKLEHPNIVAAYDADKANGIHFLVMQFVEGSDLAALIKKDGPLPIANAVNIVIQTARGLEEAHKKGIIHRDIKPSNLLLDESGTVKILDMGLARIETKDNILSNSDLTGSGNILGTVDYMAPEQALSTKNADARADIYSLGCTLYYLLSGKPMYEGDTMMAKLLGHREHPLPRLADARPDIPASLQPVFEKMVAKRVEDRFQTMTEVISALQHCDIDHSISIQSPASITKNIDDDLSLIFAAPPSPIVPWLAADTQTSDMDVENHRKRNLIYVAVAAVGVAIVGAGMLLFPGPRTGTLAVEIDQPDAIVTVLDAHENVERKQTSETGKLTLDIDPGKHRLKVEKDHFVAFSKNFEIAPREKSAIVAKLEPEKTATLNVPPAAPNDTEPPPRARALVFDGVASHVVTPLRYDGSHPLTWEAYITRYVEGNEVQNILSDSETSGISLLIRNGRLEMNYRTISSTAEPGRLVFVLSSNTLFLNRKYHVAGVFDDNTIRLYVDGVLQGSTPGEPFKASPMPVVIGANPEFQTIEPPFFQLARDLFEGIIRDVRISKIARYKENFTPKRRLSSDEDTIALYHLDDGAENIARDASNHGNHASIVDARWIITDSLGDPKQSLAGVAKKLPVPTFADPEMQAWANTVAAMPNAKKQFEAVAKKIGERNPGFDGKLNGNGDKDTVTEFHVNEGNAVDFSPLRVLPGLKSFQYRGEPNRQGLRLSDLSQFAEMRLEKITINFCDVTDLSPLRGMPLNTLNINATKVTDLSALKGVPLTDLNVGTLPIADLSPLQGMPLKKLSCLHLSTGNLSPLHGMPLTNLSLSGSQIEDLTPLKGMPLKELTITGTSVTDLSPLSGMALTSLTINGTKVSDLSPLQGMPLTVLLMKSTPVSDLSPLQGMRLQNLSISDTKIESLEPLNGMSLLVLECQRTAIVDISPLAKMPRLSSLDLKQTKISPQDIAELQQALPKCKITSDDSD